MDKIQEINENYEKISLGTYPFVSKTRITILKKGFYRKDKANYRGVSMIYDKEQKRNKALLIGYFYVPEDVVVVPDEIIVTEGLRRLITHKVREGYNLVTEFPSLKPYEFAYDSQEYQEAMLAYNNFRNKA